MAARRTTKKPVPEMDAANDASPAATSPASDAPAEPTAAPRESTQLLVARSLFRADKWDPDRDATAPFEWEPQRSEYLARAARLIRLLDKDGLEVTQA